MDNIDFFYSHLFFYILIQIVASPLNDTFHNHLARVVNKGMVKMNDNKCEKALNDTYLRNFAPILKRP